MESETVTPHMLDIENIHADQKFKNIHSSDLQHKSTTTTNKATAMLCHQEHENHEEQQETRFRNLVMHVSVSSPSNVKITLHAAAAEAAAAAHVQSPHKNASAAKIGNGYTGAVSMSPNYANFFDAIGGGYTEESDKYAEISCNESNFSAKSYVDRKKSTDSPKRYYHPLYAHGICGWPGCEIDVNDFAIFVK
ncbi:forkhead box protein P1-B-like isoform X2 [Eurosta solidaginis]|uniref:forkhead box protein P1-B-like isoform X2 n=1 Tax=Eurosta solidaginis TaxID=178769 RepID=UPI00353153FC